VTWRSPDRLDRQVADLWGVAALGAIALLPFSRTFLSALPLCPLRSLTGLPCPTCGATRAAEAMLGGHVLDAVLYNPLVTLAAIAFLVVGIAAPMWIRSGGRLPSLPATPPVPARIAIALGLVGNWAWVLAREW
jgi:hypothetical protein